MDYRINDILDEDDGRFSERFIKEWAAERELRELIIQQVADITKQLQLNTAKYIGINNDTISVNMTVYLEAPIDYISNDYFIADEN